MPLRWITAVLTICRGHRKPPRIIITSCGVNNREDPLRMNSDAHVYVFYYTRCHLPQARSQFKSRSTANNVSILVPVPSDADSPKFKTTTGSTKWIPEKNVVQWNIKSFPVSAGKIPLNLLHRFGLVYC